MVFIRFIMHVFMFMLSFQPAPRAKDQANCNALDGPRLLGLEEENPRLVASVAPDPSASSGFADDESSREGRGKADWIVIHVCICIMNRSRSSFRSHNCTIVLVPDRSIDRSVG